MESLLSLFYPHNRFYFRVVREVYEAYVLYCFSLLMANYLGDEQQLNRFLREKFPATAIKHTMPFCCFTPWKVRKLFVISILLCCSFRVFLRVVLFVCTVAERRLPWQLSCGSYSTRNISTCAGHCNRLQLQWESVSCSWVVLLSSIINSLSDTFCCALLYCCIVDAAGTAWATTPPASPFSG